MFSLFAKLGFHKTVFVPSPGVMSIFGFSLGAMSKFGFSLVVMCIFGISIGVTPIFEFNLGAMSIFGFSLIFTQFDQINLAEIIRPNSNKGSGVNTIHNFFVNSVHP